MKYALVGKIVNSFGIRGEMKVTIETDNLHRFDKGNTLYIGEEHEKVVVSSSRIHKGCCLLTINESFDINSILNYINKNLYVDLDEVRKPGEIYFDDLIDCMVYDNDILIGKVIDILEVPQGSLLQIEKNNKEISLVPNRKEFINSIDIENKKIVLNVIEGLL